MKVPKPVPKSSRAKRQPSAVSRSTNARPSSMRSISAVSVTSNISRAGSAWVSARARSIAAITTGSPTEDPDRLIPTAMPWAARSAAWRTTQQSISEISP